MDLYGAPYAYTPFCSSRKEMDGFRYDKLFLGLLEITFFRASSLPTALGGERTVNLRKCLSRF